MNAEFKIKDNEIIGIYAGESVDIPNTITRIGEKAFEYYRIKSITIPSSVTSIGDGAFYGCHCLTSVTIPSSVTSIGDDAFYGCTSLTRIKVPKHFDDYAVGRWGLPCGCEVIRY